MEAIESFLQEREASGLMRRLRPISSRHAGKLLFDGREYLDFSSNDYLGLSEHPAIIAVGKDVLDRFGSGSSASRLLSGTLDLHNQLEEETACFKKKEAALVFNSGYQANVGILSALYGKSDVVFADKLSHASIIDGIKLSGAKLIRFEHNDPKHLKYLLSQNRDKFDRALIVTETIFSMDGDRAPLRQLVALKDEYKCELMVDEAHATGIYGEDGSGVAGEEGLSERIDFIMGTFSKALGSFGAYLATSKLIKEYLINTCRSFIYSTSLPPVVIASNIASLGVIRTEPVRRKDLLINAKYFSAKLKDAGFKVLGDSQIVPIVLGENKETEKFASALQGKGYWVLPIRPPTVPQGQARLRFSLTYHHDRETIDRLIKDISDVRV